jgi:hypothetical protein
MVEYTKESAGTIVLSKHYKDDAIYSLSVEEKM